jgi:hypothetical protein
MEQKLILMPLIAMAALVFIVFGVMFRRRVGFMKANRLHPQKVATSAQMAAAIEDSRASDNVRNLFEAPVLFYVAVLTLFTTGLASPPFLILAWFYVVARYVHSYIHCMHNTVMQRFYAYLVSMLALLVMWVMLAYQLLSLR